MVPYYIIVIISIIIIIIIIIIDTSVMLRCQLHIAVTSKYGVTRTMTKFWESILCH